MQECIQIQRASEETSVEIATSRLLYQTLHRNITVAISCCILCSLINSCTSGASSCVCCRSRRSHNSTFQIDNCSLSFSLMSAATFKFKRRWHTAACSANVPLVCAGTEGSCVMLSIALCCSQSPSVFSVVSCQNYRCCMNNRQRLMQPMARLVCNVYLRR